MAPTPPPGGKRGVQGLRLCQGTGHSTCTPPDVSFFTLNSAGTDCVDMRGKSQSGAAGGVMAPRSSFDWRLESREDRTDSKQATVTAPPR